jgi:geranylgeranyl diphosphate synthase type II
LSNFTRELVHLGKIVEEEMVKFLPKKNEFPPQLFEAMHYSTLSGGKRLRPIMVMKAAELFGMSYENVMPTACGIEMIHTYSLIHDDLPVMDNDDFRRGKPTCHKVYGEALALLAGDALLTHAFATIAMNSKIIGISLKAVLDVIEKVSLAAGGYGMIGGQVIDIETSGKNIDRDTLYYISNHKTGYLIKISLWSGARLAGASKEDLEIIELFGEKIGLAFQIVDDMLDEKGDENTLGKPVGSDIKNLKNTFVSMYGNIGCVKIINELSLEAKKLISHFKNSDFFIQLTDFIVNRSY